tara:strand:- start:2574 stop:3197 length:624 start_codon:yes stop_codon:yes gene_type:complete
MMMMEAAHFQKVEKEMGNYSQYARKETMGNYAKYAAVPDSSVQKPQNVSSVAYTLVSDNIGADQSMWNTYREEIAKIESAGDYSVKGGYNNHYDGRYQMGRVAKTDAATLLGYSLKHDSKSREAFRNDKVKQEEAFAAFTVKNHDYLMAKSKKYRSLSLKDKLSALGYAHNQGWSGASSWLKSGKVGSDAFGTRGTKYSNAIKDALK